MLSQPLEIHQMNWIRLNFVNQIKNFLKNVQEHEFSKNRFSQKKRAVLRLFAVIMIFKIGYGWFT